MRGRLSLSLVTWGGHGDTSQLLLGRGAPDHTPLVLPHLDLRDGDPLRDGGNVDLQNRNFLPQYSRLFLHLLPSLKWKVLVMSKAQFIWEKKDFWYKYGDNCSPSLHSLLWRLCIVVVVLANIFHKQALLPESWSLPWIRYKYIINLNKIMIIKLYLLRRSVSNDDGFHLYLKWLHSYFVLFVQFIPESVTILETTRVNILPAAGQPEPHLLQGRRPPLLLLQLGVHGWPALQWWQWRTRWS